MFAYVQGFIVVLYEILCCKVLFETFAVKREHKQQTKEFLLILLLVISVYFFAIVLARWFLIKEICIVLVTAFVMSRLLRITPLRSFAVATLFQGLLIVVDYIQVMVDNLFFGLDLQMVNTSRLASTLVVIMDKTILFLVVLIINRIIGRRAVLILKKSEWFGVFCFAGLSIGMIAAMLATYGKVEDEGIEYTFLFISVGLAAMNLEMFKIINDILKREEVMREHDLFELKVENQTQMYRSISENFDEQRKRAHEYKNQIMCIHSLLKKEEYATVEEFVQGIDKQIGNDIDAIQTNHVIVDAILNTKYKEAVQKKILFLLKINDLSKVPITDEDIVILLSNILNNAMEACEQCKERPYIKVKFVQEDIGVIISVSNTYTQKFQILDGKWITTKDDKINHGIGSENMRETIEKYGGSYTMRYDEKEFRISILIPV